MQKLTLAIDLFYWSCIFIWVLMLYGAWASSLERPHRFVTFIKIKKEYAVPIMKAMTQRLVILLGTVALGLVTYFNQYNAKQEIEGTIRNTLSLVSWESNQKSVSDTLVALATVHTDFDKTLAAYNYYIGAVNDSKTINLEKIKAIISNPKDVFDNRVLGFANDMLADNASESDVTYKSEHFDEAEKYYKAALDALNKSSDDFSPDAYSQLNHRLLSNIAGVHLSKAQIEPVGSKARKDILLKVQAELTSLKNSTGLKATYLNLAAAYSLLGEYDKNYYESAISILREIKDSKNLQSWEVKSAKLSCIDLDRMHEYRPLSKYVDSTYNKKWNEYVDSIFS